MAEESVMVPVPLPHCHSGGESPVPPQRALGQYSPLESTRGVRLIQRLCGNSAEVVQMLREGGAYR